MVLALMSSACLKTVEVARGTFLGSALGMATGYRLDDTGTSLSPSNVKNFHISISSIPALGSILPPVRQGTGGRFPGRKGAGA
jgi:hypothetical protein